ncbi:hypothetical protein JCM8097_008174 [Rhodosporidiobolus ruineniae]
MDSVPSLQNLAVELKIRIVEHLVGGADLEQWVLRRSHRQCHPQSADARSEVTRARNNLKLVHGLDRDFRAIVASYLHQAVDLTRGIFAVTRPQCGWSDSDETLLWCTLTLRYGLLHEVKKPIDRWAAYDDLLFEVVSRCGNLRSLRIRVSGSDEQLRAHGPIPRTLAALSSEAAARLENLVLEIGSSGVWQLPALADLVSACQNLRHLELVALPSASFPLPAVDHGADEYGIFAAALDNLPSLHTLHLRHLPPSFFIACSPSSPIAHLSIVSSTGNNPPVPVQPLVQSLSPTLSSLTLGDLSTSGLAPLDLPLLNSLSLSRVRNPVEDLAPFSGLPITHLHIHAFLLDKLEELLSVLDLLPASLRHLDISQIEYDQEYFFEPEELYSRLDADRARLAEWCKATDVACEAEELKPQYPWRSERYERKMGF